MIRESRTTIVHAQLKNGAGNEIEANDSTAHTPSLALVSAMAWGRGALSRTDDPDAYVVYTTTESKATAPVVHSGPVRLIIPENDDAFIHEPASGMLNVSISGRRVGQAPDLNSAVAFLAEEMKRTQYWPNVWYVNERGNTTLLSVNVDTGEYTHTDMAYV